MSEEAKITVVMPVYNEAETIRTTLTEAYEKIAKKRDGIRFVVSEDGSTDGTKNALLSLAALMPSIQISLSPIRKGYPKAARDVILSPDGGADYILFMDSDGQYDPSDFHALRDCLQVSYADMVIGRRLHRAESPLRIFLSTALRVIEKWLFRVKCEDVTSAFRLMKREPAQNIARMVKYSRYNFWSEFTALASLNGYRTLEIPVSYRPRQGSSRVYRGNTILKAAVNELATVLRTWSDFYLKRRRMRPKARRIYPLERHSS